MIRIVRSPEPAALAKARTRRLAAATAAYEAHGAPSVELTACLIGYTPSGVKTTLHRDQRKKCAWCERVRDYSSSPVEHYRPKDGAWRHQRKQPVQCSSGHYWWLAWTWDNLLFACARCNDRGHKANFFPLARDSSECAAPPRPAGTPPAPGAVALSDERPLLLDPAVDRFLDHVTWVASNTKFARRQWIWSPKALTERGATTIDVLKLHELADDVAMHLAKSVLPSIEEIEQHLAADRVGPATTRWNQLLHILDPVHELTAATWCALELWMPATTRQLHGLTSPPRPS